MTPLPGIGDLRPATTADLEGVAAAVVASQRANGVDVVIATEDDLAGIWSRPSMDLATDTRVVDDDTGRVVAYACARSSWRARCSLHAARADPMLAVERERVVGAAIGFVEEGDGWVDQLAVAPDAWGRGIGGGLLTAAFGRFHDRGLATARLMTESRTGALDLYLHVGMEVDETFTRWTLSLQ